VEINSIDQIRAVTFPHVRRGYDPREVEKFLEQVAEWLERGGGDEVRTDLIRRELQRVGDRTAGLLTSAEDTAQQLRADAEREADELLRGSEAEATRARTEADAYAVRVREEADGYSAKLHTEADTYSQETNTAADRYAETTRTSADQDAERRQAMSEQRAQEVMEAAERKAKRIVTEGTRRRREIEKVIADLVARRNAVIDDANRLSGELAQTVAAHTPDEGEDQFSHPRELDPGEGAEPTANGDGAAPEVEAEAQ